MHLVTKNTVDFTCNSTQFGKEVQNQLGFLLEKDFYPKLENLLNLYDDKNEIWKIDFLNIDLGKIEKKNWKETLVNRVLLQIEEYLKTNKPLSNLKKTAQKEVFLKHEFQEIDEVISAQIHAKIIFFKFLKSGDLEVNAIANDLQEIIKKIKIDEVFIQELIECFLEDSKYILRFIFSAPDNFKESVFKFFSIKRTEEVLQRIINSKQKIDEQILNFSTKTEDVAQQKIWLEFLELIILLSERSSSAPIFAQKFVAFSKIYWNISETEIQTIFKYFKEEKNHFETKHFEFFKSISKKIETEEISLEDDKIQTEKRIEKPDFQNALYIENAGLVILHPFLQTLFEKLDFCDNEIWKSEICQQKAILLSQYLVTGKVEIQENELLLNKILCGFESNKVINTKLKITDFQKEQCESLLKAVLEHWTAMRTSSTTALQETFLQRKAKLEEIRENQFEIWVEEKGFDVLLNQLPWGIGMIKTVWMEEFLICNW